VNPASSIALPAARTAAAVLVARCAARASLLLGRGGTSLPGLVSLYVEPQLVRKLAAQLGRGSLVIAGTNGKTTTSALTAAALTAGGHTVVHNRAGSNMLRGVATTLARRAALSGRLRAGAALTGLFEVDEAALPGVLAQLSPRVLVLTNLFRDQLDRYAELATTADRWRTAIAALPATTTLVLNADDPLVASLGAAAHGPVRFYGVERWPGTQPPRSVPALSADSLFCPRCAAPLDFSVIAYAHLGHYSCPACGLARPTPDVTATVEETGATGSRVTIRADRGAFTAETRRRGDAAEIKERVPALPQVPVGESGEATPLKLGLPGRYNVYNALAAVAGAVAAGVPLTVAARAVEQARGAFGRAETVNAGGRTVRLFLIKNPTGADAVLEVIGGGERIAGLLCLLSDNAADGHDVSWIWDAQFEAVAEWHGPIFCGGTRAEDMALRLKYAGFPAPALVVPDDVARAVREALASIPSGGALDIVATYTAMLAARDTLARDGHVQQYWRTAS
jgi:UDP-N-acetylmuramyl tripeptide synthase